MPGHLRVPSVVPLVLALPALVWATGAIALPPGRAWTPVTRFAIPGYAYAAAPRLEVDESGRPLLLSITVFPSDAFAFDWVDSAWVQRWQLGHSTLALWPVQSPPGTHYLVWRGLGPVTSTEAHLFLAEVLANGVGEPDTVARVNDVATEYSAAVSRNRRWAAVADHVLSLRKLRIFYSEASGPWRELAIDRPFGTLDGVALACAGDSSALVAWVEDYHAHWASLEGTLWTEGTPFPDVAGRLQFRERPSGGQWLVSAGFDPHAVLRSHREGAWSAPETLRCAYRDGRPNHYSGSPDLSRDEGEYPVVVWDAQNIRALATICVCVPTDSGYGIAEELEGSEGDGGLPTVARDRNGDVWVAWFWYGADVRWLHSYTRATASTPCIAGAGRNRRIEWTLSEPAPETWWAVMRARGAGDFEEAARVRAGPGLQLSWTDSSPPAGLLRYKIRRESVDVRYVWESEAVQVPEGSRRPLLHVVGRPPVGNQVALEVEDAALGPFDLLVYDVQGRIVHRQRGEAAGSGREAIALDLAATGRPMANGVYFATVRDAAGEESPARRLVILR